MIGTRKIININDQIILSYIEQSGLEPAIIFLHGWGGSAESFQLLWKELLNTLSFNRRLIAIDFPGFGESAPLLSVWNLELYSKCILDFLNKLKINKVDIVSHSFGGRVTTKLLNLNEEKFRKVVYIAPAGIKPCSSRISSIATCSNFIKKIFSLPLLNIFFPYIRKIGYKIIKNDEYSKLTGPMKESFKLIINEDLKHLLQNINKPVQIFWGANDTYVPVSDGKYMEQVMPNSKLFVFNDGRHGIHKTHAQQIVSSISHFLSL